MHPASSAYSARRHNYCELRVPRRTDDLHPPSGGPPDLGASQALTLCRLGSIPRSWANRHRDHVKVKSPIERPKSSSRGRFTVWQYSLVSARILRGRLEMHLIGTMC